MKHLLLSILLIVCICIFIFNIIQYREGLESPDIFFNNLQNERDIQSVLKDFSCVNGVNYLKEDYTAIS